MILSPLQPAYQNLRQRVETSVSSFLSNEFGRGKWTPGLNKNQIRNQIRKKLQE